MTHKIVWKNEHKNLGIIVNEENENYLGLSHELRKGALNTLGVVSAAFMEAWGDMTAYNNCIVETVNLNEPVAGMTVEMALESKISRILQDHDRCPPAARDYSRQRMTLVLIMQEIVNEQSKMVKISHLKDCMKCGRKRYE